MTEKIRIVENLISTKISEFSSIIKNIYSKPLITLEDKKDIFDISVFVMKFILKNNFNYYCMKETIDELLPLIPPIPSCEIIINMLSNIIFNTPFNNDTYPQKIYDFISDVSITFSFVWPNVMKVPLHYYSTIANSMLSCFDFNAITHKFDILKKNKVMYIRHELFDIAMRYLFIIVPLEAHLPYDTKNRFNHIMRVIKDNAKTMNKIKPNRCLSKKNKMYKMNGNIISKMHKY